MLDWYWALLAASLWGAMGLLLGYLIGQAKSADETDLAPSKLPAEPATAETVKIRFSSKMI